MRESINPLIRPNTAYDQGKLPKHVKPSHYQLTLEPDLEKGTYQGTVHIDLEAIEETTFISLNLTETKVIRSFIVIAPKVISDKDMLTFYDTEAQVFTIILRNDIIPAGRKFLLALEFEGSLDKGNGGFFRSSYVDPSGELKWVASTQMEAIDARKAFPCFDEPALKATFRVALIADHHFTCLGNMDVAEEYDIYSNFAKRTKKVVVFNNTPLMSTYLVSFAVGELNFLETNEWRVPIRIYATSLSKIEDARLALKISARVMKLHEEAFGIKYPLPKLDQIEIPGHQGGMENWGLVNYGPGYLIYDEKTGGALAKQTQVSIIAHELAHQWFGDIVTMEFWDGIWLNESFASWAQSYIQDKMFPETQEPLSYLAIGHQEALELDSNRGSHPIQIPITRADDIYQAFDAISYQKGESILKMLVDYIGLEDFLSGVRLYLKRNAFGNSQTSGLWQALAEVCGLDVAAFMSTWTEKVGYPVLTVTEDSSSKGEYIQVSQKRYLKSGDVNPKEDETIWHIPINILTKTDKKTQILSSRTDTFSVPHEFYKLNANQAGFYRVEYPPLRLISLAQAAKSGLLSVEDRIGIISDAAAFAISGFKSTPTTAVLSLLDTFSSEKNFFVWIKLVSSLGSILEAWKFHPDHARLLAFKKYLTVNCLKRVGLDFSNIKDKLENDQLFQVLIFNAAGQADNEDVVKVAKSLFDKWINGDQSAISADARDSILAIAIRRGTSKEFSNLLNLYNVNPSPDIRSTILTALGHTQIPDNITKLLNLWLQCSNQESPYYLRAIRSLSTYKVGADMTWDFVKEHWDEFLSKATGALGQKYRFVPFALAGLGTSEHFDDVKDFFYGQGKDTTSFANILKQALDTIETRAKWVGRDGKDVSAWLDQEGY